MRTIAFVGLTLLLLGTSAISEADKGKLPEGQARAVIPVSGMTCGASAFNLEIGAVGLHGAPSAGPVARPPDRTGFARPAGYSQDTAGGKRATGTRSQTAWSCAGGNRTLRACVCVRGDGNELESAVRRRTRSGSTAPPGAPVRFAHLAFEIHV